MSTPPTRPKMPALRIAGIVALITAILLGALAATINGNAPKSRSVDTSGERASANPSVGAGATQPRSTQAPAAAFAREVTTALLTWDTEAGPSREDAIVSTLDVADPSGLETPGLLADLTNYVPDPVRWQHLTRFGVAQTVTVDTATVPAGWTPIAERSGLQQGTVAITIHATSRRTGNVEGQPQQTEHPVRFTMFVHCTDDNCHLLRLSRPGQTLN